METRKLKNHHSIRGFLALEVPILILIFYFVMGVVNNGIVNVIQMEMRAAAESAALGGAGMLYDKRGQLFVGRDAIEEASRMALLHSGIEGPVQPGQVSVSTGTWINCLYIQNTLIPNAVKVSISIPVNDLGETIGFTSFFGQLEVPFFQRIEPTVTAVAAYYADAIVLTEFEGNVCLNINLNLL